VIVRDLLAMFLGGACVATALATCFVQAQNHECARALARAQRHWEMLEAANAQASARALAHVPGVSNFDLDVTRAEVSERLRLEREAGRGAKLDIGRDAKVRP
jgi:hypothetical protein